MANKIFEVQGPNGKTYEVEAPDMQTAVSAASQFIQGGGQSSYIGRNSNELLFSQPQLV